MLNSKAAIQILIQIDEIDDTHVMENNSINTNKTKLRPMLAKKKAHLLIGNIHVGTLSKKYEMVNGHLCHSSNNHQDLR